MKRLLITALLLAVLTALPISGFGQELKEKSLLIAGINYDEGISADVGWGGTLTDNVAGGRLYGFGRFKFGETALDTPDSLNNFANAALEIAVIWPAGKLYYGLLLNPLKVDWLNIHQADWNTYLANAFGGVLGGNFNDRVGIALDVKYNFDYTESLFQDGLSWGLHAHIKLGSEPQTAGL